MKPGNFRHMLIPFLFILRELLRDYFLAESYAFRASARSQSFLNLTVNSTASEKLFAPYVWLSFFVASMWMPELLEPGTTVDIKASTKFKLWVLMLA
ncbi:hypothetical protein [Pseudomonas kitaguniensis]|uniref:hypothetical protein n=1 Tax=Pseudomonas kitaguniensis TaxID=2607908 RepID=UPI003D047EE9